MENWFWVLSLTDAIESAENKAAKIHALFEHARAKVVFRKYNSSRRTDPSAVDSLDTE